MLTIGEKIKVILGRKGMTLAQLADLTGQSRQNLSNKMSRDKFTEQEARVIAEAFDGEFVCSFKLSDGTEI